MKIKTENEVTLQFPSQSSNEGFIRSAVACFAAQMDPTLNELEDIKTAVSEAATNAIVHAYPDRIGKVTVKWKRPGSPCSPPEERNAAAWASPSWRALWIV